MYWADRQGVLVGSLSEQSLERFDRHLGRCGCPRYGHSHRLNIERNIRSQLAGMLDAGGFDPAQDIEEITVNRWAHGYAYWYNPLFDPIYDDSDDARYPHMRARKPFGRIAIANSDAGARANLPTAVEQGYRAVTDLI